MDQSKQNFIHIINENRGIILSLCQVYYARNEDQKDAFQDVVLQLWKSFDSFRGEAKVSTWIYRVSLNTLLSKVRKEKKSVKAEPVDQHRDYVANALADDHKELLSLILRSLKADEKAIVVLHLEGYKNKEIADMLKLSPSNVATKLNRIKNQLKTKFNRNTHATQ